MIDNGQHDGIEYQILMFGQDECVFQSAADLPTPCHKDYVTKDKDAAKMINAKERTSEEGETTNRTNTCSMGDHWLQEQDGVIIRKHLIPRISLYVPELDDPIFNTRIKLIRTTYIRHLDGRNDIINDP